jgi:multidrug efflux system membrane fusion protein
MKKPHMLGVSLMTIAICLGGAVALVLDAEMAAPSMAASSSAVSAIPVVAEKVRVSDMPIVLTGIGTVAAYNSVAVHAQVTGTIQKIGFVEGQTVQPGSVIAQLDPRLYQAALQQAQANLARDQANLDNAQANLGRYVPLQKQGFATPQQVGDQTASVEELHAAIASDNAAIATARTQLDYTTITSPISGVTGILNVDIGNLVQPADTKPIVTLTQVQPISVVFTLPQADLPTVQAALAKHPLKAIAYSQDGTKQLDEGTLLLVDNVVSQSSGTVQLKATFPNAQKALWPGDFVNVRLVTDISRDAVSVPLSALQQGQDGSLVYVVMPDGTVQSQPVTIGETLDGRALVESGLRAGDTVVTAGQYRLSDGAKAVIVPADDPHVENQTPATQGMLQ